MNEAPETSPRPIDNLINEVRLLYHALVQVGETLHRGTGISLGMRAVMEYLERNGPTTVPDMARARRVTRQRIQALVNALVEKDLVSTADNPASKRSPLIVLTDSGAKTILGMRRLEATRLDVAVNDAVLSRAAETLAAVRDAVEASA